MSKLIVPFATLCIIAIWGIRGDAAEPAFETPYERSGRRQTPPYREGIAFYQRLAESHGEANLQSIGRTDAGFPLHLLLISPDGDFDVASNRRKGRCVLLINNAIHAGESDGVDASMLVVRDLLADRNKHRHLMQKTLIAVIPYYNVGGALNRDRFSRANQNGPDEYGFRANARYFDLNRDFMKCDTRNSHAFAEIFQMLDPDVMVDTHVSNGADFQYVMTTTETQKDKLGGALGKYFGGEMIPRLYRAMEERGFPTSPYVNSHGRPPDEQGFEQYLDTPRYSTGYAALFQTLGLMSETHMLKPYPRRVEATRALLTEVLALLARDGDRIRRLRSEARSELRVQANIPVSWRVDRTRPTNLLFHGYQASHIDSEITQGKRLFYDRTKPFSKTIPFYDHYRPEVTVSRSEGYLIPQSWHRVIERLRLNRVQMIELAEPTRYRVQVYRVVDYTTRDVPYEGHYFHDSVTLSREVQSIVMDAGSIFVPTDQDRIRYVIETLEPEASDSFFRWNFFDTILQQKEYYSSYVFEDTAKKLLRDDADLRERFERKKRESQEFSEDTKAQLEFLYRSSPHYEKGHLRYPVLRVLAE